MKLKVKIADFLKERLKIVDFLQHNGTKWFTWLFIEALLFHMDFILAHFKSISSI